MSKQKSVKDVAAEIIDPAAATATAGPRWLGPIERIAIAKLAYNATAQYLKISGRSTKPWDELYDAVPAAWNPSGPMVTKRGLADEVALVETQLRGSAPSSLIEHTRDAMERDVPGSVDFFLGVVEAAVKIESGWKPVAPVAPQVEALYRQIDRTIEGLVERAVEAMCVPKLVRLSPRLGHAWAQRTNRVTLTVTKSSKTIAKAWTAKGDVVVREDRRLHSDDAVLLMAASADGRTVCFAAAVK